MNFPCVRSLLICLALLCSSLLQSAVADDSSPQWIPLFNGSDLSGWVTMNNADFSATNGVIHLAKSKGWLRTEKLYTNFVFEAEWRAVGSNYNSGFFIRAGLDGTPFPKDVWQINLKRSALGELLRGSKNSVVSTIPLAPLNQWLKFRIEVRGTDVFLDVHGKRAWEFHHLDADYGFIGLQAEGSEFDFRNLRVQVLP